MILLIFGPLYYVVALQTLKCCCDVHCICCLHCHSTMDTQIVIWSWRCVLVLILTNCTCSVFVVVWRVLNCLFVLLSRLCRMDQTWKRVRGRSVIGAREVSLGISFNVRAVRGSSSAWIALKSGLLLLNSLNPPNFWAWEPLWHYLCCLCACFNVWCCV